MSALGPGLCVVICLERPKHTPSITRIQLLFLLCVISFVGWDDQAILCLAGSSGGNSLGNPRWSPKPDLLLRVWALSLAPAGPGQLCFDCCVVLEIYKISTPRPARVWAFSKNVMIFHLEMMHFTQFCRTVLSILTGIFINLALNLHLGLAGKSGSRCHDSWTLPEILPGYALFYFIWCLLSTVLLLYSWIITAFKSKFRCMKGHVSHLERVGLGIWNCIDSLRICILCVRLDLASVKVTYTRIIGLDCVLLGWLQIQQVERFLLIWRSYEGHGKFPAQQWQKHITSKELLKLYDTRYVDVCC